MNRGRRVLLVVSLGGAAGSVLRAAVEQRLSGDGVAAGFPWSTLAINTTGSFALALLTVLTVTLRSAWWVKPALGTGVLGGFTTFSAYVVMAQVLQLDGSWPTAAAYLLLTPVVCVVGAWLGAHVPGLLGLPHGHAPLARAQE
ncbi:MAG: CrcB family protein [Ornithinimicrobium sp.]